MDISWSAKSEETGQFDDTMADGTLGGDACAGSGGGSAASVPASASARPGERRRAQMKEASQRRRKGQKQEVNTYKAQIAQLRQEIATLRAKLAEPVPPLVAQTRELAKERYLLQQQTAFLRAKMEAHWQWKQELRKLLITAPLLDLEIPGDDEETKALTPQELDDAVVDAWRDNTVETRFSMRLVRQLLQEHAASGFRKARLLLNEFANPACNFELQFASRGWALAVNTRYKRVTFRAMRMLARADARTIANELWLSMRREEVLRTFIPIIVDCVQVYETESLSASRRMFQLSSDGQPRAVDTVESIQQIDVQGANTNETQISIASLDEPCLRAFAVEQSSDPNSSATTGNSSSNRFSDAGNGPSTQITIRDLLVGISCRQEDGGVFLRIVGNVLHEGQYTGSLSTSLLQHLVTYLPVYEDVHLAPRQSQSQFASLVEQP